MATTEDKDVLRLFITEAAFLGGSKKRQLGFDKTTKRILMHNDTDDTLAGGWSDDSLQVLLAGAQNVSGTKTFLSQVNVGSNSATAGGHIVHPGTDPGDMTIANRSNNGNLILTNSCGSIILAPYGITALTLDELKVITAGADHMIQTSVGTNLVAPFNMPQGVAKTSPDNGDEWKTDQAKFLRIDSKTIQIGKPKTVTLTLTGCSGTPPTVQATYQILGDFVHLFIPQILGPSNSTNCTITGVPSEIWPPAINNMIIPIINNSLKDYGEAGIQAAGTITLRVQNGSDASWNASGSKGLDADLNLVYKKA